MSFENRLKKWLSGALEVENFSQKRIDEKRKGLHKLLTQLLPIFERVKAEEKVRNLERQRAEQEEKNKKDASDEENLERQKLNTRRKTLRKKQGGRKRRRE